MLPPSGNPFKCHGEVLYFQPMIPPKRFDIFPPDWGMFRKSRRVLIFLLIELRARKELLWWEKQLYLYLFWYASNGIGQRSTGTVSISLSADAHINVQEVHCSNWCLRLLTFTQEHRGHFFTAFGLFFVIKMAPTTTRMKYG